MQHFQSEININKQDIEVKKYLEELDINYNVIYKGGTTRNGWECDSWEVEFKKGKNVFTEKYFTGLGLRLKKPAFRALNKKAQEFYGKRSFVVVSEDFLKGRRYSVHVVPPTAAGVLYSLLLDASANDYSFNDWCDCFGYNNDSMADFKLYQKCCNIARELRGIFCYNELKKLGEILEDY